MLDRNFETSLEFAKRMDQEDVLKEFRSRFYQIDGYIYMDGNSLGLCSKDAEKALLHVFDVWKKEGIAIWHAEDSKYFTYSAFLGAKMAPLVGANPEEVCVTGNTTINIHQAFATLYKPTKDRYKVLVDDLNFPTDRYAVDSQVRLKGYTVEEAVKVVPSPDGKLIDEDAVIAAMTPDVAIVLLPAVLYRSAQLLDMEKVTKAAHERGIIMGWDLCHCIGAVPVDFNKIQPDFAIWCNYKYLSSGPGSTAGVYVNKKHFDKLPGLAGWFGNKNSTQFRLDHKFEHEPDASGWQTGTPSLLSMAPVEGLLDIFLEAGIDRIRAKSLHLTAYLMYLIENKLAKYGYSYDNPTDDSKRGGHVCLVHDDAYRICGALKDNGVLPDFREPNVIRLAPIAVYNTYEDAYKIVEILENIIVEKKHEKYSNERSLVV